MAKKVFTDESLATLVDETKAYVDTVASGKVDKVSGKGLSTNDYTTTEKNKLSGIATGAEVNQNAFSNVVVGSTTIAADSKTDSLTIAAGTGISVAGDATNDKVTITNSGVRSITTGSSNGTISVDTNGTSVDVAVKGLGSAAYTASTAYDAAGTAQTKADAALASAKSYTDTKTSGLASTTVVDNKIDTHNTATSAHNDIRALISDLSTKLNNFLDVDDSTTDQLSEVLTLINNNKGTLESLTSSKINVSDIVNNLTTNSTSKVLSAAQGVAIQSLIDALELEVGYITDGTYQVGWAREADKAVKDSDGNYINTTYETKTDAGNKLTEAKNHATTAANTVKTALIDGADASHNTLKKLGELVDDNSSRLNTLMSDYGSHTHNYAGSSSAGGAATSANKVNKSLTVKLNGGSTEGTNMFTFNGSAAKSVNITPSAIGAQAAGDYATTDSVSVLASSLSTHNHDDRYYTETEIDTKLSGKANSSHGNHVPTTQTADNAVFLRNDNTWATVTPANIGAAASSHTHSISSINSLQEALSTKATATSVDASLSRKADKTHTHDDRYYTETEIDNMVFITLADIDTICSSTIVAASAEGVVF